MSDKVRLRLRDGTVGETSKDNLPEIERRLKYRPEILVDGPSKTESGARGGLQGLTFGFGDELAGVANALTSDSPLSEGYRYGRDAERDANDASKKENPKTYLGGEVAGGLASAMIPGGILAKVGGRGAASVARVLPRLAPLATRAVATGAAAGALGGLGGSKADSLGGAAADTATGAVVGGALGKVGEKIGGKLADVIAKLRSTQAIRQRVADEARVLTSRGTTGGSMANAPILAEIEGSVPGGVREVAEVMRRTPGLAPRAGTIEDILLAAQKARGESNKVIGAIRADTDAAGVKLDSGEYAKRLAEAASKLRADRPTLDPVAQALEERGAEFAKRFPTGMTMEQAQKNATDLGSRVNWSAVGGDKALGNVAEAQRLSLRPLRDLMRETAQGGEQFQEAIKSAKSVFPKGASGDVRLDYPAAQRVSQVSTMLDDAATESLQRAATRNSVGLTDAALAAPGAAIGSLLGPGGAAAGASILPLAYRHVLMPRQQTLRATYAETKAALAPQVADALERIKNGFATQVGDTKAEEMALQLISQRAGAGLADSKKKAKAK